MTKLWRFIFLLFSLGIGILSQTSGQGHPFLPKFRKYGISEGLSTSSVTAICQDKEGKVWIGTHDGLNCSYGTFFKVFFQSKNGLPQSAISDILCDQSGILWILTYGGGLARMNPVTQEFLPLPKSFDNEWIQGNCIAEDRQGRIWIGYYEGLKIFDPKSGVLESVESNPEGKGPFSITRIAFDREGNAWIATPFQGLFLAGFSSKFQIKAHLPFPRLGQEERGLGFFHKLIPRQSGIMAVTQNGIFQVKFQAGKIEASPVEMKNAKGEATSFLVDSKGRTWLGTSDGKVFLYEKDGSFVHTHFPYRGRYETGGVVQMLEDNMGGIWIGGDEGLSYTHPQLSKFISFTLGPQIQTEGFKIVWSIYTENDEDFLIGSQAGLFQFNSQRFEILEIKLPENQRIGPVYSFVKSPRGSIVAGTSKGLVEILDWKQNPKVVRIFPELKGVISSLLFLPSGELLAGSYDDRGLYKIPFLGGKTGVEVFENSADNPNSICNNSINILTKGLDGKLLIGTDNGLSAYDPNKNQFSSELYKSIPREWAVSPLIYGLVETKRELWLGTFGSGILIYQKSKRAWSRISKKEGLRNESVYCLARQGNHVWASTNLGIARIDIDSKKVITFTEGDGLQSNEYNHFSMFENPISKRIYFGGIQGFDEVSCFQTPGNPNPPKVVLSSMEVLGTNPDSLVFSARGPWTFSPRNKDVELEFAAINYLMPEKNQYAYTINGNNVNRIFLGTKNKITLLNLEKGVYSLEVFGANNEGIWNPQPLKISFEVLPFFWETWWFQSLIVLLFIIFIFIFIRLYLKANLRKQILSLERQQAIREDRNRISAEMHDDLGSGLTSIKMLSDLLLLKMKENTVPEIQKIASRSEELVDNLNTIIWALNDRNDEVRATVAYLRQFAQEQFENLQIQPRIEGKVDSIVANQTISGEIRRHIFLILKEAINNIIKHSNATRAWVQIHAYAEGFEMLIMDNGTESKTGVKSGGNGLVNMRKRAQACGGFLEISNEGGYKIRFFSSQYYESVIGGKGK